MDATKILDWPFGDMRIYATPDREAGARARRILEWLRPRNVVGGRMRRMGGSQDGGYVVLHPLAERCPIYSLGVGGDVSFDLEAAQDGHSVFQYDGTVDGVPAHQRHPAFHFFHQMIDSDSGSLERIIANNGHEGRRDLFLKMDIEGYELSAIPSAARSTMVQFAQIAMELHRVALSAMDETAFPAMERTLEALRRDHELIHVHANNWGWYGLIGGVPLPDTLELTWVRRADHEFTVCDHEFPTALDRPCNPNASDYYLGRMGLV